MSITSAITCAKNEAQVKTTPTQTVYSSQQTAWKNRDFQDIHESQDRSKPEIEQLKSYTTRIKACKFDGNIADAERLFIELKNTGLQPNVFIYTSLMSVYVRTRSMTIEKRIEAVEKLMQEMQKKGIEADVFTYNCVINAYAKAGNFEQVIALFKEMQKKGIEANVSTYNCVINAYAKASNFKQVIALFQAMQKKGIEADVITYNCMIDTYAKASNFKQVIALFQEMQKKGIEADVITYTCVIDAYAKAGNFEQVIALFKEMQKKGIEADVSTYNCVINAYAKAGNFEQVIALFQEMQKKGIEANVITYNCMINAYAKASNFKQVIALFQKMQKRGIQADVITYTCVIDAYAKLGYLPQVNQLSKEMESLGIAPNLVTHNAEMTAYATLKKPKEAIKLLALIAKPDLITYNHFFNSFTSAPRDILTGKQWIKQALPLYKEVRYIARGAIVDCHEASHGAACFLIAFYLDEAIKTKRHLVQVIIGQSYHSKDENIGKMYDITSEFIKKHYADWNIQKSPPGRMTLTRLPLSSSSQKDHKQSTETAPKISSSLNSIPCVYHTTTRRALQAIESLEKEDIDPSIDLYNNLFECCEIEMKAKLAKEQVQKMLQRYVQPNSDTYKILISLYTKTYALNDAMACFSDLQHTGMIGNKDFINDIEKTAPALFTTLIDQLVAAGKYEDAVRVLNTLWYWRIPCDPQSYNLLIEVYQQEVSIFRQQEQLRELFAKTSNSLEGAAPDQSAIEAADTASSCLATIRDLRYTQRNLYK